MDTARSTATTTRSSTMHQQVEILPRAANNDEHMLTFPFVTSTKRKSLSTSEIENGQRENSGRPISYTTAAAIRAPSPRDHRPYLYSPIYAPPPESCLAGSFCPPPTPMTAPPPPPSLHQREDLDHHHRQLQQGQQQQSDLLCQPTKALMTNLYYCMVLSVFSCVTVAFIWMAVVHVVSGREHEAVNSTLTMMKTLLPLAKMTLFSPLAAFHPGQQLGGPGATSPAGGVYPLASGGMLLGPLSDEGNQPSHGGQHDNEAMTTTDPVTTMMMTMTAATAPTATAAASTALASPDDRLGDNASVSFATTELEEMAGDIPAWSARQSNASLPNVHQPTRHTNY